MKRVSLYTFLPLAFIFVSISSNAQQSLKEDLAKFNEKRVKISRNGMGILGGWAAGNMLGSGTAYFLTEGEAKYFHQMNFLWNIANLSIAIPGYMGSKVVPEGMGPLASLKAQKGHEKIFLFNTGLDVGYIMGGFFLREFSSRYPQYQSRLTGYGNSLIVQGGFLMGFDVVMYLLHRSNAKKKLEPILDHVEMGAAGMRIKVPLGK